jgi:hypothetical protein
LLTICLLVIASCSVACESKQAQDHASELDKSGKEAPSPDRQPNKASQVDIPDDQALAGMTEADNFYVVVTPEPNPIPFQELFELEVKVFSSDAAEAPVDGVALDQVRATMPAHGHGMKTKPKVTRTGPGTFRVEGMKFHMQGEGKHGLWVVETVLSEDGTIDQAKFDVQCCHE